MGSIFERFSEMDLRQRQHPARLVAENRNIDFPALNELLDDRRLVEVAVDQACGAFELLPVGDDRVEVHAC